MVWQSNSKRRNELPRNWTTLRRTILTRDHYTCQLCGKPANHVDHIQRGNNHSPANLRALCEPCHMARTGRDGGRTPRRRPTTRRPPEAHPGIIERPDHEPGR